MHKRQPNCHNHIANYMYMYVRTKAISSRMPRQLFMRWYSNALPEWMNPLHASVTLTWLDPILSMFVLWRIIIERFVGVWKYVSSVYLRNLLSKAFYIGIGTLHSTIYWELLYHLVYLMTLFMFLFLGAVWRWYLPDIHSKNLFLCTSLYRRFFGYYWYFSGKILVVPILLASCDSTSHILMRRDGLRFFVALIVAKIFVAVPTFSSVCIRIVSIA